MERWHNRVAVVTGASSGIGAATCQTLVNNGMIVVGMARRLERMQQLKATLPAERQSHFHPIKCDLNNEDEIIKSFAWIDKHLGGADVLINNAGIVRYTKITTENNSNDLRATLDTNVLAVAFCTREAFSSMRRRGIDDGHMFIVNSVAGHSVPIVPNLSLNMYSPSKYAVTALTEVLRQEFNSYGTKIKITSISPGAVKTEITDKFAEQLPTDLPMLSAENVADAILYCVQTPPNVHIQELIIKPVGETF